MILVIDHAFFCLILASSISLKVPVKEVSSGPTTQEARTERRGRSRRTHWKACGESFQHGIENTKTVAKKQYKIKYPARGYEGWDFCDTSLNFLLDHIYTRQSQATDKDPVVTLSRMMLAVIKFI